MLALTGHCLKEPILYYTIPYYTIMHYLYATRSTTLASIPQVSDDEVAAMHLVFFF